MANGWRSDKATIGFRTEGLISSASGGTGAGTYSLENEHNDYGTTSASVTDDGTDATFTNSSATWATDRLIGATVYVWDASTKGTRYGSGTIDDNDGTTFTVTLADFSSSPSGGTRYYEIDTFAIAGTSGAYTNDLGIEFDAGLKLPTVTNKWQKQYVIGGNRNVRFAYQGNYETKGTLSGRLKVPRLFAFALGKDIVTGTDPYTHTMTPHTRIPSFCMEAAFDGTTEFVRYYRGTVVNSLKITSGIDEPMMCEAEIMTAIPERTTNSKSTVSLDTDTAYMWYHAGDLTFLSNSYAKIVSFEWEYNNNISEETFINSTNAYYPDEMTEGGIDIACTLGVRITDYSIWDEVMSPTSGGSTMSVRWTRSANDYLDISMNDVQIEEHEDEIPEEGPIDAKIKVFPVYDGTNQAVTVVGKDSNSSYML